MDEQSIKEAPQRRILQGLLTRIDDADRRLNSPGQQGPQGRKPQSLCVTWGPIGLQTPRREGSTGFYGLAPLVSPGTYLTPNYPSTVNPFVATPGPFYWCSSGVYADFGWTYTSDPDLGRFVPVAGVPQAGLFDPAIEQNGGGIILNNFAGTQQFVQGGVNNQFGNAPAAPVHPRICAEIDIYDKTRGRSLTSGRVPLETFTGGGYGFKSLPEPLRFERGSQIEPRLYVTECRMTDAIDGLTSSTWSSVDVKVYVTLVMKGYNVTSRNLAGFPSYDSVGGP